MVEQDIKELTREDAEGPSRPRHPAGQQAFRKISRELTEQDLANSAVQKLLLSEIDRLEKEKEEYKHYLEKEKEEHKHYVERFHEADKKVAVLEQKSRTALALDIIFGGCLTVGGSIIGLAREGQQFELIVGGVGVVVLIIGIVAKVLFATRGKAS